METCFLKDGLLGLGLVGLGICEYSNTSSDMNYGYCECLDTDKDKSSKNKSTIYISCMNELEDKNDWNSFHV